MASSSSPVAARVPRSPRAARRWLLRARGFDPATARHFEGLFTQGSGTMHLRGTLEEPAAGTKGTYVAGVFADHPDRGHELVNLPWFLGWTLEVEGEVLDPTSATIEDQERMLDLRDGLLRRALRWRVPSGGEVRAVFERFVSAARTQACCQRVRLYADHDCRVKVTSILDADVRTNGFDHFAVLDCRAEGKSDTLCTVTTNGGDAVDLRTRHLPADLDYAAEVEGRRVEQTVTVDLQRRRPIFLEKRTVVTTSRDLRPVDSSALLDRVCELTWKRVLAENRAVWFDRWEHSEVRVEGDPESRRALRVAVYHLLRSHVPEDLRVAIGARGTSGEERGGRFTWETDLFLLPFFLYTAPLKARTLVDFRVATLDGARANAKQIGAPGAKYPCETTTTGRELGRAGHATAQDVHPTADAVYAWTHYARAVDPDYLLGTAAEAIVEAGRYLIDRVVEGDREVPHLYEVTGPDGYTPACTDDAFTNWMVRLALTQAVEVGKYGGAGRDERSYFRHVARRLPLLRTKDKKLVLSCAEFEDLMPIAPEVALARKDPTDRAMLQVLERPTVLALAVLFPDDFSDDEVTAAWDRYAAITDRVEPMTQGMHLLAALRIACEDEAWNSWRRMRSRNLDAHAGGAAEGIHTTNAGLAWTAAVMGFAGMQSAMWTKTLTIAPRLPRAWGSLSFPVVWQGVPALVEVDRETARVTNRGTKHLEVCIAGEERTLAPGQVFEAICASPTVQKLEAVLFDLDGVLVKTTAAQAAEDYANMTPADVLPGAPALLSALQEAGIPTAIVSASKHAAAIAERTGLAAKVTTIIDANVTEEPKSTPEAFLLAAERLGVAPSDCLVIDDCPLALDVATRTGLSTLPLGPRADHPEADCVVAGLDELTVGDLRAMVRRG